MGVKHTIFKGAMYTAGAMVLGAIIGPTAKKTVRPMIVGAIGRAMMVSKEAKALLLMSREEWEDVVAEARYIKENQGLPASSTDSVVVGETSSMTDRKASGID